MSRTSSGDHHPDRPSRFDNLPEPPGLRSHSASLRVSRPHLLRSYRRFACGRNDRASSISRSNPSLSNIGREIADSTGPSGSRGHSEATGPHAARRLYLDCLTRTAESWIQKPIRRAGRRQPPGPTANVNWLRLIMTGVGLSPSVLQRTHRGADAAPLAKMPARFIPRACRRHTSARCR